MIRHRLRQIEHWVFMPLLALVLLGCSQGCQTKKPLVPAATVTVNVDEVLAANGRSGLSLSGALFTTSTPMGSSAKPPSQGVATSSRTRRINFVEATGFSVAYEGGAKGGVGESILDVYAYSDAANKIIYVWISNQGPCTFSYECAGEAQAKDAMTQGALLPGTDLSPGSHMIVISPRS